MFIDELGSDIHSSNCNASKDGYSYLWCHQICNLNITIKQAALLLSACLKYVQTLGFSISGQHYRPSLFEAMSSTMFLFLVSETLVSNAFPFVILMTYLQLLSTVFLLLNTYKVIIWMKTKLIILTIYGKSPYREPNQFCLLVCTDILVYQFTTSLKKNCVLYIFHFVAIFKI